MVASSGNDPSASRLSPLKPIETVEAEDAEEFRQPLCVSANPAYEQNQSSGVAAFDHLPFSLPRGIAKPSADSLVIDLSFLGLPKSDVKSFLCHPPYGSGMSEFTLDGLIGSYFLHLYQRWPLLHLSSFCKHGANAHLLWMMVITGARCNSSNKDCQALAEALLGPIFEVIMESLLSQAHLDLRQLELFVPALQAAMLYVVYSLYFGDEEQHLRAEQINNSIITILNRLGGYHPQVWTKETPLVDPLASEWILIETRKRLTTLSFVSNVYISILLNKSPTIDYRLLNCRLPCRSSWWWSDSPSELQNLQSIVKERIPKPMRLFIDNILAPEKSMSEIDIHELEVGDCHLIQCAMYGLITNLKLHLAQHQSRGHGLPFATNLTTEEWENNIDFWRTHVDRPFWKRQSPGCLPSELKPRKKLESVNLILYHYTMMQLHSPLSLIISTIEKQSHVAFDANSHYRYSSTFPLTFCQTIQTWSQTPFARLAAFHAGQIFFHYSHKQTSNFDIGPDIHISSPSDESNPSFASHAQMPNHSSSARPPIQGLQELEERQTEEQKIGLEPLIKPLIYHSTLLLYTFTSHRTGCHTCVTRELQAAFASAGTSTTTTSTTPPSITPSFLTFNPTKLTLHIDHPFHNDFVERWVGGRRRKNSTCTNHPTQIHQQTPTTSNPTPVPEPQAEETEEIEDGLMKFQEMILCRCNLSELMEETVRILEDVEVGERGGLLGGDGMNSVPDGDGDDFGIKRTIWMEEKLKVVRRLC